MSEATGQIRRITAAIIFDDGSAGIFDDGSAGPVSENEIHDLGKETTTDIHSHAVFEAGKKPVLFNSEQTKDRSESFTDKESTSGG
ncbi:hypothetical protein [Prevotella denticola]|uniref:hypothetical protein n=1 Tax=Prevotella denticola TaxID=28129 RepID=UPI00241BE788|nr:hypothetical protein [Prevotella denticola]